jgi:hypothetical protein
MNNKKLYLVLAVSMVLLAITNAILAYQVSKDRQERHAGGSLKSLQELLSQDSSIQMTPIMPMITM